MNMFNNLPLYMMDIDGNIQEDGVDFVALVDRPAIQKGFLAFNDHGQKSMAFSITSEDRHIVSGPLMLADTPIYRYDNDTKEEYYVIFSAPVIEKIVKKLFSQGKHANVNEMHDASKKVDGVWMFESFIADKARGVSPMRGYEDARDGSWFVSFQVDNKDAWQKIKDGTFTGFSVEGVFVRLIPVDSSDEMCSQFTETEQEQLAILSEAFKIFT